MARPIGVAVFEVVLDGNENAARLFEPVEQVERDALRACEPVELRDRDPVRLATLYRFEGFEEPGASGVGRRPERSRSSHHATTR